MSYGCVSVKSQQIVHENFSPDKVHHHDYLRSMQRTNRRRTVSSPQSNRLGHSQKRQTNRHSHPHISPARIRPQNLPRNRRGFPASRIVRLVRAKEKGSISAPLNPYCCHSLSSRRCRAYATCSSIAIAFSTLATCLGDSFPSSSY